MLTQGDFKFSATVHTEDIRILKDLRTLACHSQKAGKPSIVRVAAAEEIWRANGHCVTFYFSAHDFRKSFLEEARNVLTCKGWNVTAQSDDDTAPKRPPPLILIPD
jgi:hypothetical protein